MSSKKIVDTSRLNDWTCVKCNIKYATCECIGICGGRYNKIDIVTSFVRFCPPLGNNDYCMKKIERDRRSYFVKNYKEPPHRFVIRKSKGVRSLEKIYI